MSDTTGGEVERVRLEDLPDAEAIEVVKAVYGLSTYWATIYLAKMRGDVGEGVIQEDDQAAS